MLESMQTSPVARADSRRDTFRPNLVKAARSEILLVALVSLLGTYAFFFEYLPPAKHVHLWSDIAGYHYPLQSFAFNTLKQGRFPTWDASIYCGISFVGNIQAALFYPLTWVLYALAWSREALPFKALEAFAFFHVWLAFVLCYGWLRGRCGRMASALGALVFGCSGYLTCELLHPGVAGAMTWLPLGFRSLDEMEATRDCRPLWKLAAASAMAFLAGYPAAWLVNCVIWVVYGLSSSARWRAAAGACAAIAGSMLLVMVQLLPVMQARSLMIFEPKYGPGAYSLKTLLLAYLLPNWFDFNPGHPGNYEPGSLYLYAGLPALFALGWLGWRHSVKPYIQTLVCLAVAFLLANPPAALIWAVEHFPALDRTMQPWNFYAGAAAMIAMLAALGVQDFLTSAKRALPVWLLAGVMLASLLWWCFELRIATAEACSQLISAPWR